MTSRTALSLALELQENCFELQRKLQQLVRQLAQNEAGYIQSDAIVPKDSSEGLKPELGLTLLDLERGDFRYTKPSMVYYPDGSKAFVRTWKDVVIKFVHWGIERDLIEDDAPMMGRRSYPLVSRDRSKLSQTHGNPDNYLAQIDGWWFDTWGNVNTKARNLIALSKAMGTDPSEFRVELRSDVGPRRIDRG